MKDPMNKTIYIFLLLFLFFSSANSKDSGVLVRPMNQDVFETIPDANVMATFRVTNQTSEKLEFVSKPILPKGWKLITQEFPFEIGANSSDMLLLSFHVPKETPAGRYEVSFGAASRKYLTVSDFYPVTVNVLPVKRLRINLLDVPPYAIAGETYTIPFQVINESNVDGTVVLDFNSSPSYTLQADTTRFPLTSGENRVCSVRVQTDNKIQSMLNHFVSISARFAGGTTAADSVKSVVKIIPAGLVKLDWYNRIPLSVGISYAMQQDGYSGKGWQFDVSGEGPISQNKKDLLRFYFRGPDTYLRDLYTYGSHDQYSISYWNEKVQVDLGDKSYTLSKLTEQYRWGRGVEAQVRLKDWNAGAFAYKTLYFWSGSVRRELSSYVRRNLGQQNAVGLNYLHKKTSDIQADILSVQGNFNLNKDTKMELEYAGSSVSGKYRQAYNLGISGKQKNFFHYSLYWVYAGPNYPGYYTNTQLYSIGLNCQLLKNLRIDFNMNQQKQQYDEETYQVVAPVYKNNTIGLDYQWRRNTRISLARTFNSSRDRFFQPLFDYSETAYRFNVDQTFKNLTFTGCIENGKTNNRMLGGGAGMVRLTFSGQYAPNGRNSFSGYLYYDNDKRYTELRIKRWTMGLDARSEIIHNTTIDFSYQNQYSPESYYEDRNLFELSLTHKFKQVHEFAVRCRKTLVHNTLDQEELALKVDYRLKLGVPIGRNRSIGSVKGTLFDMENQKPVRDVVVRLNEYMAVTDNDGRFYFQALPPGGDYYLSVDKSTIGMDKVLMQRTPLQVNVTGGSEKTLDLGILRGVAVKGKVMVYAVVNDSSDHFKAEKMKQYLDEYFVAGSSQKKANGVDVTVTNGKTKLVPDYGLGDILVELTKENEAYRRITDNDGSFYFDGLRPGIWTLKVYEYNLPEMHRLENPVSEINLNPGKEANVLVKVLPIRRQIKFIQQEGVILEEQRK